MLHYIRAGESASWPGFFFAVGHNLSTLSSVWELRSLPQGGVLLRGHTAIGALQVYVSHDHSCELFLGGLHGSPTHRIIDTWNYGDEPFHHLNVFNIICPDKELRFPRYRPKYSIRLIDYTPNRSGMLIRVEIVTEAVGVLGRASRMSDGLFRIGEVDLSDRESVAVYSQLIPGTANDNWWRLSYRQAIETLGAPPADAEGERQRRRNLLIGRDPSGVRYY